MKEYNDDIKKYVIEILYSINKIKTNVYRKSDH